MNRNKREIQSKTRYKTLKLTLLFDFFSSVHLWNNYYTFILEELEICFTLFHICIFSFFMRSEYILRSFEAKKIVISSNSVSLISLFVFLSILETLKHLFCLFVLVCSARCLNISNLLSLSFCKSQLSLKRFIMLSVFFPFYWEFLVLLHFQKCNTLLKRYKKETNGKANEKLID